MPEPVGFFTDTTICIGCKACQVACHQWNDLPAGRGERTSLPVLSGDSYDNTVSLSDVNWRHVKFIEKFSADPNRTEAAWLMMSDVCKHCVNAPCLEVCPTGAILRTEFDTVYINEPACNGCRDCVSACPFGVIHMSPVRNVAQKCTFCYDRLKHNLAPACAQACPTQSIYFGPMTELKRRAQDRVEHLHRQGQSAAHLYGADESVLGGLNAFYLLMDTPETYGLPSRPIVPSRRVGPSSILSIFTAILTGLGMLFAFRGPHAHGAIFSADCSLCRRRSIPIGGLGMSPFAANPEWGWWIVGYFFLGGIAAGCYFIATLIEITGRDEDRPLARLGYRIAFPLVVACGVFLTIDLDRPERFWHMLLQSEVVDRAFEEGWPWSASGWSWMVYAPMLKVWSPMSIGAWALFFFGGFSMVSCWASIWPEGRIARLLRWRWIGWPWRIAGAGVGFFVASYTGVLLEATNQPIWSQTIWLGPFFLASAASTGIAALVLLSSSRNERLDLAESWAITLELAALALFLASLGPSLALLLQTWAGQVAVFGVLILGVAAPLALTKSLGRSVSACLVLLAGLLLRYGLVFAPGELLDNYESLRGNPSFWGMVPARLVEIVLITAATVGAVLLLIHAGQQLHASGSIAAGALALVLLGIVVFYGLNPAATENSNRIGAWLVPSPERGRERGGGAGASELNHPEPLEPRSKIFQE